MGMLKALTYRNVKLFFKDKGMFFTAMITPLILLVLYVTFLGNVYKDSFVQGLPQGVPVPDKLINGLVGGQLLSSLLAVCCVTVAFCSNLLVVQDKVSGARDDIAMTPVKGSVLAASYFISTAISTLLICFVATGVTFVYLAAVGWYLSVADALLFIFDVFILSMFGTALSSVISHFLSTQGQMSAVGSIISSVYGFVCGAYMPISQFGKGLQNVIAMLPGTYGTSLLRKHAMNGAFRELSAIGIPDEGVEAMKDVVDANVYFFGKAVSTEIMYAIIIASVLILAFVYVILNRKSKKTTERR